MVSFRPSAGIAVTDTEIFAGLPLLFGPNLEGSVRSQDVPRF